MIRRAALSLSLLLLASGASLSGLGICQTSGATGWDADGGYTGDYSAIPKLEWRGPGQPGTHADYLRRRGSAPFTTKHVATARPTGEKLSISKALVIVDTTLRAGIQARLDIYVTDLVAKGYTVEVHEVSGGFGTYRFAPFQTDLFGGAFMPIDFTAPPAGPGSGRFFPGEEWMFQFWYRDPVAGGSGFNLSDWLSVQFCS